MNAVWLGFERVQDGEQWEPGSRDGDLQSPGR
jgi:hypothetical protein